MGNVNTTEPDNSQDLREQAEATKTEIKEKEKEMEEIRKLPQKLATDKHYVENTRRTSGERETLLQTAIKNCRDETVLQWLRENFKKDTFSKLVDVFHFLKKHIDEEEKKNHSDDVDITFWAHGSIRLPMIPACCLLPLSSIRDMVLHAPWNCVTVTDVTYGVATGKIKPQHRKFYCSKKDSCQIPDEKHRPTNLPDYWNSMKEAGGQTIPTITVSPLQPEDGVWKRFESLKEKHGPPGRNRIFIPFILPGNRSESVPFCVVTLALSLVLLNSRFKAATVHLSACLRDQSAELKHDEKYLQQQYAFAIDNTGMTVSADMFTGT